jgi:hypothetical protein
MKYRKRKKIFFEKFGHVAVVCCNSHTKFKPIVYLQNIETGRSFSVELVNPAIQIPERGEHWVITYTKSGKVKALNPKQPSRISKAKMREISIFVDRMFFGKDLPNSNKED